MLNASENRTDAKAQNFISFKTDNANRDRVREAGKLLTFMVNSFVKREVSGAWKTLRFSGIVDDGEKVTQIALGKAQHLIYKLVLIKHFSAGRLRSRIHELVFKDTLTSLFIE